MSARYSQSGQMMQGARRHLTYPDTVITTGPHAPDLGSKGPGSNLAARPNKCGSDVGNARGIIARALGIFATSFEIAIGSPDN